MNNPEVWRLVTHNLWKTNPISITTKRPGVNCTTIANFPARATVTPEDSYAYARMMVCAIGFCLAMLLVTWWAS
jgi:hypothetical protein